MGNDEATAQTGGEPMEELSGRVVVITGGASGIGRAMADRFAAAGSKLVLADVDQVGLAGAVAELEVGGATALGVPCDVTDPSSVVDLRDRVIDAFGAVHVVCLNAGVAPTGPLLDTDLATWRWVIDVNLMGVIHGIDAFGPVLVAAGEGHVVCTSSGAGLVATPLLGAYSATKHAVVAVAEVLYQELRGSGVGVTVVCPSLVRTGIFDSERSRTDAHGGPGHDDTELRRSLRVALASMGASAGEVADAVVAAVREERLYVLPHQEIKDIFAERAEAILGDRAPEAVPTDAGADGTG